MVAINLPFGENAIPVAEVLFWKKWTPMIWNIALYDDIRFW